MAELITEGNVFDLVSTQNAFVETPVYSGDKNQLKQLMEDISVKLSNGVALTIQKGFQWDEASVPYIFRWAFPKSGKYAFSALVHDALYYSIYISQKFADNELKFWMKKTRINNFQIFFRYIAVRIYGFSYWDRNVHLPSDRCIRNRSFIHFT